MTKEEAIKQLNRLSSDPEASHVKRLMMKLASGTPDTPTL